MSHAPNILTDLPPPILNFPDYVAAGFNPDTTAAQNIRCRAGYPPDIVRRSRVALAQLFEFVLGSDAMPMAEAPR